MVEPPAVRRATAGDREAMVRTLARAFDADPVVTYFARRDAKRGRAIETIFDVAFMRLTLPFGETWMTEDGRGAALWTPPDHWNTLSAFTAVPRLIGAVGITRALTVLGTMNRLQERHPKTPPHYYLFALGVDPEHQGRGLGSAMLRAVLSRCDADGVGAYLEASTPMNARLYARHGFRVTEELTIAPGAPTVSLMWREPKR